MRKKIQKCIQKKIVRDKRHPNTLHTSIAFSTDGSSQAVTKTLTNEMFTICSARILEFLNLKSLFA